MTEEQLLASRKLDHIHAVLQDPEVDRQGHFWDAIQLSHRALPEMALDDVDLSLTWLERPLAFPLMISSMSGGADARLVELNQRLAEGAEHMGVALAVGSQRIMFKDSLAQKAFALRHLAPNIPLIANLGAVQLNYGFGLDEARRAVDILHADALYLHLNPLQEAIQPEGDRHFGRLADKIHSLVGQLHVPVILKEVGCGLSVADIQLGLAAGVKIFDVAGRGGTSWSRIEHHRQSHNDLGIRFQDWGIPTPRALTDAVTHFGQQADFIASGGVRHGLDAIKSLIMGGLLAAAAKPFLPPALTSTQALIDELTLWKKEMTLAAFLLGQSSYTGLRANQELVLA